MEGWGHQRVWESELMMCTNSFNNPKQFEEERKASGGAGINAGRGISSISLVAYMCNLDSDNAWKHLVKKSTVWKLEKKEKTFRL